MKHGTDTNARKAVGRWRRELSLEAKNGINFILAACVVWSGVAYIWTLPYSAYNLSILTFIAASLLLPLAWLLSRILKTAWSVAGNPIEPLGLWLNFAQLCYFPFLIFVLLKYPEHFVMTLAIITGAHLFPYAWFYDAKAYAVAGVGIPVGSLLLGLALEPELFFWIPLFVAGAMGLLAAALYASFRREASR
jgi:hypothetical protein